MSSIRSIVSRRLHRLFPQRQIYIRCIGQVQFFTFTPVFQAVFAFIALFFLMWATYATVLVVFKDRSIAALDDRYRQTQTGYQTSLTNLQDAYIELTSNFGQAKRRFDFASQDVATKQGLVAALLNREDDEELSFAPPGADLSGSPASHQLSEIEPSYELSPVIENLLYRGDDRPVAKHGAGLIGAASHWFMDLWSVRLPGFFSHTIGFLFSRQRTPGVKVGAPPNPSLLALEGQITRLQKIDGAEVGLLTSAQAAFARRENILRSLIRSSHIDPDQYLGWHGAAAMGGPEIPTDQIRLAGTSDPKFTGAYLRASAVLDHLSGVFEALRHFPFAMPVAARTFEPTSGFGPRLDPFSGHTAFHPGLDFGGPVGMPVFATAAGLVVFTGDRGSYGNVVEIDHGMGFHTRYAHLSVIAVRLNSVVAKGSLIGRVGSTGRSTGPHLHYEVWYDDVVRDPAPFIIAGRSTVEAGAALKGSE